MKTQSLRPMPTARRDYAAATMDGKIYIAGGCSGGARVSTVECYDPINDTWTSKQPMIHARRDFSLLETSKKLYALGDDEIIEQYDPVQNEWTEVRMRANSN